MKKQPYQDWVQWVNVAKYIPQEELDKMPQLIGPFMIKIGLPTKEKNITEWVWARRINDGIAEIRNLPSLATNFKYKDLVEFNPKTGAAKKVVFDGGYIKTQVFPYPGDFSNEKGYWESWGYIVEGVEEGIISVTRKRKNR
jgi:hypothetical protein